VGEDAGIGDYKMATIGDFINFSYWQEALKLLNFQILQQQKNRHFKTLSMIYYKKLGVPIDGVEKPEYFEKKVQSNLFYGMQKEFSCLPYMIPKSNIGLRKYRFFSYPLRVTYYSVGLYIFKLSYDFLAKFMKQKSIKSYYGGNMSLENNDLVINENNIYFKKYYKQFRNHVRQETSQNTGRKIVIRLDIQDYYDEIRVPVLLNCLEKYVMADRQAAMNFNQTTKEQIEFFFRYLARGGNGIPQADNDLISSFLGYLYLVFADILIEREVQKAKFLDNYKIIRYVDDIFICLAFNEFTNQDDQKKYAESLSSRIADLLYYELALRLNPKSRFFCLWDDDHLEQLLSTLKKVSPSYHIDNEDDEPPANKIENIFHELYKIKGAEIQPELGGGQDLRDEIFKDVFDERVRQMLNMEQNKAKIREIFTDFDFDKLKAYPLPLLILALSDNQTTHNLRSFLISKKSLTTRGADLIIQYLCQLDFQDTEMIKNLENHEPIAQIVRALQFPSLSIYRPGYYNLTFSKIGKLAQMPYVIEQIRYRIASEQSANYSLALNHLLNEMHAVCYELEQLAGKEHNAKDYDANDVDAYLDARNVPFEVRTNISKLFNRRNTNQVSHPGTEKHISWSVSKYEYEKFLSQVGECLELIL
jgi:AbiA family abortive infection protein